MESRKRRSMVWAVKPLGMPALQRRLKGNVKKFPTRASLQVSTPNWILVGAARVRFDIEKMLKKVGMGSNAKKGLAEMNKNCNL